MVFSLTAFNSENSLVRFIFIIYSFLYPFLLILVKRKFIIRRKYALIVSISLLWVIYFFVWFALNLANVNLNISGPNVEMLTPLLLRPM